VSRRIATVAVLDFGKGSLLLDGEEVAPHHWMGAEPTLDISQGAISVLSVDFFVENVLVLGSKGSRTSPTAAAEGRAIVRKGLADVLEYLGEKP
jgi:hypothetical protein